jgi:transposase
MTKDELISNYRYSVLQHARKNKNITDTCRLFHLSRTTYYKWLMRFNKFGYLELKDRERSKPKNAQSN